MPEMARSREQARHALFFAHVDCFIVALGAAGMNDAPNARLDEQLWAVGEWEKRIRRGDWR